MEDGKRKEVLKNYIEGKPKIIGNQSADRSIQQNNKRMPVPHNNEIRKIYAYLTRAQRIVHADYYIFFVKELVQIRASLLNHGYESWEEALNIIEKRLIVFGNTILRDEEHMITETFKNECIDELLTLEPLESFGSSVDTSGTDQNDIIVQKLIDAVKEDVKKGNRATFKLMQELETKLEELASQSHQNQHEHIQEAVQEMKKQNQELIHLAMEMLDQMDLINSAVEQLGNEDLQKEIKKLLESSLLKLEEFGLEELKVKGSLIDGKTMISLGNVPREQYAPELEQYHVYSVHKRGFRDIKTKELIRKATVITVN